MAVSVANLGASTGTNISTVSLAANANIQAGDLVVVAVGCFGGVTVSGVSDGTNTYAKAVDLTGTSNAYISVWYKANASAVTTPTIVATFSGTSSVPTIAGLRASGMALASPADKTATATGTSTNPSVSTGTLSQITELVIGAIFVNGNPSFTEGAGFTQSGNTAGGSVILDLAYETVNATTSITYSPTLSPTQIFTTATVSFKAASNTYKLACAGGSYTLTGAQAAVKKAMHLVAAPGAYTLTGKPVTRGYALLCGAGSYVLSGVGLVVTDAVAPASKFLIRQARYVLQQIRTKPPTLDQ